jgi:hypothetical protein
MAACAQGARPIGGLAAPSATTLRGAGPNSGDCVCNAMGGAPDISWHQVQPVSVADDCAAAGSSPTATLMMPRGEQASIQLSGPVAARAQDIASALNTMAHRAKRCIQRFRGRLRML